MSIAAVLREGGLVEAVDVSSVADVETILGGKAKTVEADIAGVTVYARKSVSDPQPNFAADVMLRADGSVGEYVAVATDGSTIVDLPDADLLFPTLG